MKKFLFILISVALAVFSLAACQMNDSTDLGFLESGNSSSVNGSSSESEKEEDSSSSETEKKEDSSSSETEKEDNSSGETGKEEDILIIINTPNGILTI